MRLHNKRHVPATNLRIVIPFCFVPQSTTNIHILLGSVPCVVMRDVFLMLAYLQVTAGAMVKLCNYKSQLRLVTFSRQGWWWNFGGTRRKHEWFHYGNSWSNEVSKWSSLRGGGPRISVLMDMNNWEMRSLFIKWSLGITWVAWIRDLPWVHPTKEISRKTRVELLKTHLCPYNVASPKILLPYDLDPTRKEVLRQTISDGEEEACVLLDSMTDFWDIPETSLNVTWIKHPHFTREITP